VPLPVSRRSGSSSSTARFFDDFGTVLESIRRRARYRMVNALSDADCSDVPRVCRRERSGRQVGQLASRIAVVSANEPGELVTVVMRPAPFEDRQWAGATGAHQAPSNMIGRSFDACVVAGGSSEAALVSSSADSTRADTIHRRTRNRSSSKHRCRGAFQTIRVREWGPPPAGAPPGEFPCGCWWSARRAAARRIQRAVSTSTAQQITPQPARPDCPCRRHAGEEFQSVCVSRNSVLRGAGPAC